MCCLAEKTVRSLAVDSVNHNLARGYLLDGFKPWSDERFRGVVNIFPTLSCTFQEHCLDNGLPIESLDAGNDTVHVVGRLDRTVHLVYITGADGVELQDVVVHFRKCLVYLRTMDKGRIAEDGNLRLRAVFVAQADGIVDDFDKMRVRCRLSIAGESQHVRVYFLPQHLFQLRFQRLGNDFTGGMRGLRLMVIVEAAFTVNAVEGYGQDRKWGKDR